MNERTVKLDYVDNPNVPGERLCVSTVRLTIDHSFGDGAPLWYETMVFRALPDKDKVEDFGDLDADRYTTREESEAGHAAFLTKIAAGEFRAYGDAS